MTHPKRYYPNYPDYIFRGGINLFVAIVMTAGFIFLLIAMWNLAKEQEVKVDMYETEIKP